LIYFRTLITLYVKNFLIITLSLVSFFVFIDFMFNKSKLVDSFNIQFLYAFYQAGNATLLIYPLTLLFAMIATVLELVKKNEFISFLSLGYSPKKLYKPFFIFSFFLTLFFIGFQFTKFSLFANNAKSIKKSHFSNKTNKNLFFKFKDRIIYIDKINIYSKTAYGIKFFKINNDKIDKLFFVKKAFFKNNEWYSDDIFIKNINNDKITTKHIKGSFLKGFQPNILNKLETKSNMTLKEAVEALYFLKKEDVNTNFIKVYIYNAIIPPLSFILLMTILFFKAPIHSRISNISIYILISIKSSILLWAMFLLAKKVSLNGILSPNILFLTPFTLLLLLAIYYFKKI
jgi:lipopolysaccharide export system permease protein